MNKKNLNVLHMAAQGDKPVSLFFFKQYFKNIKEAINSKDDDHCTPLHWACYCNSHQIINFLLSLGAEVNSFDINKATPMQISLKKFDWQDTRKQLVTIQRLYNSGANPRLQDIHGNSAYKIARNFPDKNISQQLIQIITKLRIPFVETGNQ